MDSGGLEPTMAAPELPEGRRRRAPTQKVALLPHPQTCCPTCRSRLLPEHLLVSPGRPELRAPPRFLPRCSREALAGLETNVLRPRQLWGAVHHPSEQEVQDQV